ncbi:ABC transporter ATP-binding protein [Clostridium lundense]|uniref:ABC transporter ATP-binding protein n=1 Tax=Clostridium lundense TaxID=319475 RepID=UPI000484443D|nr:ABC transporter ATP-binding protein [Clostridium lundense]
MSDIVIKTRNLNKIYKNGFEALKNVNITVESGSLNGFIGENGAGKTTLINILSSLSKSSCGEVEIFGKPMEKLNNEDKLKIAYVGDEGEIFSHLKVEEFWDIIGSLYKTPKNIIKERSEELLNLLDLREHRKKLLREFSKGMKKKAYIGAALIHDPLLIILDEPLEGVDAVGRIDLKKVLKYLVQTGVTIFISSHDILLLEDICTHITIIHKGKIKYCGEKVKLYEKYKDCSLEELFLKIVQTKKEEDYMLSWRKVNE